MWNFIEVQITKDLKWLIKDGNPNNLEQVWENIFSEYNELSQDRNGKTALELVKSISYLEVRLANIQAIVDYLRNVRRCDALIILLQQSYGYRLSYANLHADLDKTITIAKSDLLKLQKKKHDYEKLNGKTTGQEITRQGFVSDFRVLSKFQGYQVRSKDITVAEYIALINDFNKSQENGRQ